LVLLYKGLDPLKGLALHVASYKNDLLNLGHLLTLEGKEEVLLHKLVIKLAMFSIVQVRLVNVHTRGVG
jgi:hypothetical protein